ncbi:hypothetical protein COY28_04755, partial [Candidatus Woesearchaeota archaeon CG_4_10_14_0_2_um_filter_57_5]
MLGFLKKKIADAIGRFSKKAEPEAEASTTDEVMPEAQAQRETAPIIAKTTQVASPVASKQETSEASSSTAKPGVRVTLSAGAAPKAQAIGAKTMVAETKVSEGRPVQAVPLVEARVVEREPSYRPIPRVVEERKERQESQSGQAPTERIHRPIPRMGPSAVSRPVAEPVVGNHALESVDKSVAEPVVDPNPIVQVLSARKEATTERQGRAAAESAIAQDNSQPRSAPSVATTAAPIGAQPGPIDAPRKGFFSRLRDKVATVTISEDKFEQFFADLEMAMLESSIALEVIDKIKEDLKTELTTKPISRGNIEQQVGSALGKSISSLFVPGFDVVQRVREAQKPYIICFVGINGSGKTTTIAKVAHLLRAQGISSVLAAGDTFRAAAIAQLEEHGRRLGVKVIKHDYGADPAAVAFDAIAYAKAHKVDAVLIDTAGRLHSNTNLMAELKKVVRVAKPDLTLFIGEAITGNDCVEQAREFAKATNLDGIVLS